MYEELGRCSLIKKRIRGNMIAGFEGSHKQEEVDLFFKAPESRTRSNGCSSLKRDPIRN